jgi:hypothetical protein
MSALTTGVKGGSAARALLERRRGDRQDDAACPAP